VAQEEWARGPRVVPCDVENRPAMNDSPTEDPELGGQRVASGREGRGRRMRTMGQGVQEETSYVRRPETGRRAGPGTAGRAMEWTGARPATTTAGAGRRGGDAARGRGPGSAARRAPSAPDPEAMTGPGVRSSPRAYDNWSRRSPNERPALEDTYAGQDQGQDAGAASRPVKGPGLQEGRQNRRG